MKNFIKYVQELCSNITMECLGTKFDLIISHDKKDENGRVFLQIAYNAPCTKTSEELSWKSGKHYLSKYMTDDEIIKKVWVAFELCIKHEIMEGFKIEGIILFNPHVDYKELLKISHKEIKRL